MKEIMFCALIALILSGHYEITNRHWGCWGEWIVMPGNKESCKKCGVEKK